MQEAYKPVMAMTPAMNLLSQPGHTAVVWSPERLNASHKQVGVQTVEARHFVFLRDQTYHTRDESEAIFQADLNAPRGIVLHTKTAYACALEIVTQWGDRGAVILESYLDVPPAKIQAFEAKLSEEGWFEVQTLPEMFAVLQKVQPSDRAEEQAVEDLQKSIAAAIEHREKSLTNSKGEMQRAREGHMGRANLSRVEVAYYREAGFEVDEAAATVTSVPMSADMTQLAEMFTANNKAIVDTFADTMTQMMQQLQLKGGQTDVSQENNVVKGGKGSKTVEERKAA